jgi:hypothetical protein
VEWILRTSQSSMLHSKIWQRLTRSSTGSSSILSPEIITFSCVRDWSSLRAMRKIQILLVRTTLLSIWGRIVVCKARSYLS